MMRRIFTLTGYLLRSLTLSSVASFCAAHPGLLARLL